MAVTYLTTIYYIDADGEKQTEERRFSGESAATDAGNCASEAVADNAYVPAGSTVVTANVSAETTSA